ncbi:hypothetical protein ABQX22_18405 [Xanthomonas sp. WHRI 1810A]|uniref:hypothetical protein n=1 Tax=Xanthomonas sp. WHRI 1810A TaxID=3161565 RepID=UPI0032E9087E
MKIVFLKAPIGPRIACDDLRLSDSPRQCRAHLRIPHKWKVLFKKTSAVRCVNANEELDHFGTRKPGLHVDMPAPGNDFGVLHRTQFNIAPAPIGRASFTHGVDLNRLFLKSRSGTDFFQTSIRPAREVLL